jgi:hypothetical protein
MRCITCRHWAPSHYDVSVHRVEGRMTEPVHKVIDQRDLRGYCHRFPPPPNGPFPLTYPSTYCGEWIVKPDIAEKPEPASEKLIYALPLSARSSNALTRAGVIKVSTLCGMTRSELCGIKNFGSACLADTLRVLADTGLTLRGG